MIEIFSSPRIDRSIIAKKHILISFAVLGVCVAMLFVSISKDSQANRDAVHKTASEQSEMWLVATLIIINLTIFYISVIGWVNAHKIRNQFSNWVYYRGKLYYIAAIVPHSRSNIRRASRIIKTQNKIIDILNYRDILIKLIYKEIKSDDICVTESVAYAALHAAFRHILSVLKQKVCKEFNFFLATPKRNKKRRQRLYYTT